MKSEDTVRLKNGTEHQKELVASLRRALENLLAEEPIAFYELVRLCRQPDYVPFGNAGQPLLNAGLARIVGSGMHSGPDYTLYFREGTWEVHEAMRDIVLSGVEGKGVDMRLV